MNLARPSFSEHALRYQQPSPQYRVFRREMHFSRAIRAVERSGFRVHTLHLGSLDVAAAARLAASVGGTPTAAGTPQRVNTNTRPDFDLCAAQVADANVTAAMRVIRAELAGEYLELARLLAESGHPVPPRIVLGQSRCDLMPR